MARMVIRSVFLALLALIPVGPYLSLVMADSGPIRRVNAPHFAGDVSFSQAAILWLGQVTPTTNYADVRVGYNDTELWVHVAVFDRRLWYSTAPSPDTMAAWDAVTLLIGLDGNVGTAVSASDYQFTGQLNWWEERGRWQAAWHGSGAGWSSASLAFATTSTWRGDAPNNGGDDRGWGMTFEIPFASLGLAAKPATGAAWGFAVLVHDRDDAVGTPIPDQKWPEDALLGSPATWGQLVFGRPSYTSPPATPRAETTVRQGLNGAVVPDAVVGGNTDCGSGMDDWWTQWGQTNYARIESFNVQNQYDVADWPCFSKYYVTFPLDAVPANKIIMSATLQLHQFGNAGAGWEPGPQPSYVQVLTVAEGWDESTLNWNNAPMAEQNVAGTWVDPLGDPVPPEGVDRRWDISGAVAEAYAVRRPLRLAVYAGDWDYHSGRYFRSSDFLDAEDRPTLVVSWGDPVLAAAPAITVGRVPGASHANLTWPNRTEDAFYDVWRGTAPYFEPAQDARNQIAHFSGEPFAMAGEVSYLDEGVDGYSSGLDDPRLDDVQVIGDVSANYFWVVRRRSGESESGNSNRVGEFDYALVRTGSE